MRVHTFPVWAQYVALLIATCNDGANALLNATEDASHLTISNERLRFTVKKATGVVDYISLDNQGLLGSPLSEKPTPGGPTGNGQSGVGPYLDCYCVPSG
jgi:rhamnogalacturonan endolyase